MTLNFTKTLMQRFPKCDECSPRNTVFISAGSYTTRTVCCVSATVFLPAFLLSKHRRSSGNYTPCCFFHLFPFSFLFFYKVTYLCLSWLKMSCSLSNFLHRYNTLYTQAFVNQISSSRKRGKSKRQSELIVVATVTYCMYLLTFLQSFYDFTVTAP